MEKAKSITKSCIFNQLPFRSVCCVWKVIDKTDFEGIPQFMKEELRTFNCPEWNLTIAAVLALYNASK